MLKSLGKYSDYAPLAIRLLLGTTLVFSHGIPKLMEGPERWEGSGRAMANLGITFAPMFWGFMVGATEALAGLLFWLGLAVRPASRVDAVRDVRGRAAERRERRRPGRTGRRPRASDRFRGGRARVADPRRRRLQPRSQARSREARLVPLAVPFGRRLDRQTANSDSQLPTPNPNRYCGSWELGFGSLRCYTEFPAASGSPCIHNLRWLSCLHESVCLQLRQSS